MKYFKTKFKAQNSTSGKLEEFDSLIIKAEDREQAEKFLVDTGYTYLYIYEEVSEKDFEESDEMDMLETELIIEEDDLDEEEDELIEQTLEVIIKMSYDEFLNYLEKLNKVELNVIEVILKNKGEKFSAYLGMLTGYKKHNKIDD